MGSQQESMANVPIDFYKFFCSVTCVICVIDIGHCFGENLQRLLVIMPTICVVPFL